MVKAKAKTTPAQQQGFYANLYGGQKGGPGKSWCSRLDCQRHVDRQQDFFLVDVDEGNSTAAKFYGDYLFNRPAMFTEAMERASRANPVLDAALQKPVVVNCRAGTNEGILNWLQTTQVVPVAQRFGIKLRYVFVSDLDNDSLNLFRPTAEMFSLYMPLIFVANLGRNTMGTTFFESEGFQGLLEQYTVPVITIKLFDLELKRQMEGHNPEKRLLNWGEAREYEPFGVLGQAEVQAYLDDFYGQLDRAERFADLEFSKRASSSSAS